VTPGFLVASALLGLAASLTGAIAPERSRTQLSSVLVIAGCGCGFVAAAGVLHTGHAVVVYTNHLLPLAGFSLVLDRFGALFVAISAVSMGAVEGLISSLNFGGWVGFPNLAQPRTGGDSPPRRRLRQREELPRL
jgi:formate hydrogenlyase subunit 3/multisubunit Na+/H+ antiporter MnhD subunit